MFVFQELVEISQQDNKKLEELKHTQTELERLLHEETQAKRDEEIVRALQARSVLNALCQNLQGFLLRKNKFLLLNILLRNLKCNMDYEIVIMVTYLQGFSRRMGEKRRIRKTPRRTE